MHGDLAGYERQFRRAGLPLFIEGWSAQEDVFTRAVPLLLLVFVLEVAGAVNLDWSLAANLAAVAGGLAILVGGWGVLNRVRRRPFFALPVDVGPVELAAFVLLPAAIPAVFGQQFTSAAVTLAVNLAIVGALYLVIGYGLVWIVRWAAGRLLGQLAASLLLLVRALPLLLIFALVLFVNTEMWQVFSSVRRSYLVPLGLLFLGLGSVFLAARIPREVATLEQEAGGGAPGLNGRQRINVGLVMFVSQSLQVLVVALALGLFFVAFGALAISPEVIDAWIGGDGTVLFTVDLFGDEIVVTEALLRVAGAIAVVSGLYYAIAVVTDATYREEFRTELTDEMRATFAARAEYLRVRGSGRSRT